MRDVDVQHLVSGDFEERHSAIACERVFVLEAANLRVDDLDVGRPRSTEQLARRPEAAGVFPTFYALHSCPPHAR